MVGHARLTCDEAGHWMSCLAKAAQVGRREEVKVAASKNKTLSESVRARLGGKQKKRDIFLTHRKEGFGVIFFCVIKVNGRWRGLNARSGYARKSRFVSFALLFSHNSRWS